VNWRRYTVEKFSASLSSEKTVRPDKSWLVKATENITIAPRCRYIVLGKLESEKGQTPAPLVCVEPAQIATEGIFSARALSRVEPGTKETSSVTSPGIRNVIRVSNSCVLLMVANFSDESLTIPKKTILGVAEQIEEPLVNRINDEIKSDTSPVKPRRKRKNEALYQKLLHGKLDHLPQEEKDLIEPIILKYADVSMMKTPMILRLQTLLSIRQ
jgi:hypothetical protein